ncbi:DHA2 family efflux MFS transporter permease subunit [Gryllotalpicola reticulitermitis]|uniref:DHA2 family efflux MFS transporter permease subunit n=1 Tax=Gryllotalpicola reticulitermitis TaxID=1184153 RepID=A0ABV8Q8N7_9MICO
MTRTRSKPLILVALLAASFLINLDTTLVNVALPALTRELAATTSQLQWVVDAYNLVFAAFLLTAGSFSDRFGRKGMLVVGLVVFGAASVIGGYVGTADHLIATRAVMGLGAAMTFPATLSLLTGVFTGRKERALAIGLWGATAGVAIALGPIVGGALLAHYSWSSIFFVLGPVAAAVIVLVLLFVPRAAPDRAHRLDPLGLVLSAGFMAALIYTVIEAPDRGWNSAFTLTGFAVSLVLLVAFIVGERRTSAPMLDVRLFRNMRFSAASAAVTISFFTLLGFIFLMTQFFQFIRGYSALSAGVHLLPVATAVAVGSTLGTRLAVRLGNKLIVTTGLVLMAVFYFWVARDLDASLSYGVIAVQMVVYGLGMGLTSAPATEAIMGAIPRAKAGVGSAVNDSTRLLGGTLGVAVMGSVYASLYASKLTATLPSALPASLAAIAHQSIGAAFEVSAQLAAQGHGALGAAVHAASVIAFQHGLSVACIVAGAVAVGGALLSVLFIPAHPEAEPVAPRLESVAWSEASDR